MDKIIENKRNKGLKKYIYKYVLQCKEDRTYKDIVIFNEQREAKEFINNCKGIDNVKIVQRRYSNNID